MSIRPGNNMRIQRVPKWGSSWPFRIRTQEWEQTKVSSFGSRPHLQQSHGTSPRHGSNWKEYKSTERSWSLISRSLLCPYERQLPRAHNSNANPVFGVDEQNKRQGTVTLLTQPVTIMARKGTLLPLVDQAVSPKTNGKSPKRRSHV